MDDLWKALGLGPGACVAFIGAGGKTTSLLSLSAQASDRGLTSVITTTTKIWPPAGMPLVVEAEGGEVVDRIRIELRHSPCVAVGSRLAESGKLVGLDPQAVCWIAGSGVVDVVLCEADGAAGRSLKVHGPGEPVVPACATSVAVVAGLDAMGERAGPDVIHRFERFQKHPEFCQVDVVSAPMVANILLRASTMIDPAIPVTFVLNKADDACAAREAERVTAALAAVIAHPRVVVSTHHSLTERVDRETYRETVEPDAHATV